MKRFITHIESRLSDIDRETVGIMASGGEVLIQWDMQLMNESEDE